MNKKSSIGGIEANIIVLFCYLGALLLAWFNDTRFLAWLLPLVFYILERENEFIKKHSAQATVLFFGYSMLSLIIVFISIGMFNSANIFSMNFDNFTGSLFLASILSVISMLILVITTIFSVIVASKVWHYEDYEILFTKSFVKILRSFIDKLMKDNNIISKNDEVIVSQDIQEEKVVVEDDSLIIIEGEINTKNEKKKKGKVK